MRENLFLPEDRKNITLGNWRATPYNQWSFKNIREIIPTSEIKNDPFCLRTMSFNPVDFSDLKVKYKNFNLNINNFMSMTNTDSLIIIRNSQIIYEYYDNNTAVSTRHILMSISKSILGLIVGILADQKVLNLDEVVTHWLPEVKDTAYRDATLRNLLDMQVGALFNENYLSSSGPIIQYRKAQGWDPLEPGESPSDLHSFFSEITSTQEKNGIRFHYVSPNSDLLGWVVERATNRRYNDLISELLWQPIGAEYNAYITVDRLGSPRCAGGLCTSTRDLAKIGQLFVEGGTCAGKTVIPPNWLHDIEHQGNITAWNNGDFVSYFPNKKIHYRNNWYVLHGKHPIFFGFGVYGQHLFIDVKNKLVVVKLSTQDLPMDKEKIKINLRFILEIFEYFRK